MHVRGQHNLDGAREGSLLIALGKAYRTELILPDVGAIGDDRYSGGPKLLDSALSVLLFQEGPYGWEAGMHWATGSDIVLALMLSAPPATAADRLDGSVISAEPWRPTASSFDEFVRQRVTATKLDPRDPAIRAEWFSQEAN